MPKKTSEGYTLIEIMVGLTIIGLLFSFGYVSFREFSRRQALRGSTKKMMGDLRLAQELALSGDKPDSASCSGNNRLAGYSFSVDSSASYSVDAVCGGGNIEVRSIVLPADISITSPSPNPIIFKSLGQGNNIEEGGSATITVSQTATGNGQTVTITSGGEIK